jgi:ubiquinone/menaquinone biosynthesis C-methylase UbiE
MTEPVVRWAEMFDSLAGSYDQSGVPFFGTIAGGLVEHLAPARGERALDVGAGRGAVTFRIAEAVGPEGRVDAIDLAPTMVELTRATAEERGLAQVHVQLADATDPARDAALETGYDLVASSLVLFFLPDPEEAVRRWLRLLTPGGRVGASTFRPPPESWQSIEDLFDDYIPPVAEAGAPAISEIYSDDAAIEDVFSRAGAADVRTEVATFAIPFENVEQWRTWSLGSPLRGLWMRVPDAAHPEIMQRAAEILERTGGRLDVSVRYTLGLR